MRRIVVTSKSETEDMEVSGDNPETESDDYALAGLDKTTQSTFKVRVDVESARLLCFIPSRLFSRPCGVRCRGFEPYTN